MFPRRPARPCFDNTGLPLPGYECRLVDREGHTIEEAGRQGVLLVRGPGLSPGYWRASEEQQARFAGGWYRTGDLFELRRVSLPSLWAEDDLFKVNGRWVVPTRSSRRSPSSAGSERGGSGSYLPAARRLASDLFVTLATRWTTTQILLAQRIDQHLAEQIPRTCCPANCMCCRPAAQRRNGKLARAELRHLADTLYHDNLPENGHVDSGCGVNLPPSYVFWRGRWEANALAPRATRC